MRKRLVLYFKRQMMAKRHREKGLGDEYDRLHATWQKKVDRAEHSMKKRQRDAKFRDFYEKFFPELRKQREEKEKALEKQRALAAAAAAAAADGTATPSSTAAPNQQAPTITTSVSTAAAVGAADLRQTNPTDVSC